MISLLVEHPPTLVLRLVTLLVLPLPHLPTTSFLGQMKQLTHLYHLQLRLLANAKAVTTNSIGVGWIQSMVCITVQWKLTAHATFLLKL
jgi:hypothetical protein